MRLAAIERFQVFEERRFISAGEFAKRRFGFTNPLDDFVLHVGDVHHVGDGVALEFEVTADEIGEDERAPVADMSEVIDGRSAAIHTDLLPCWVKRNEFLN